MSVIDTCIDGNGDRWEFYKDSSGEWRWRRQAANGLIIGAASEGYADKADCIADARSNGMDCTPA